MNQYETSVEQPPEPEEKDNWYQYLVFIVLAVGLKVMFCLAWAGLADALEKQGVAIPKQLDMRQS
jgi:hypothetical protein